MILLDEPTAGMSHRDSEQITTPIREVTEGRTPMGDPELVLMEQPTERLAPKTVEQVAELLLERTRRGVAVLLVAQKLTIALRISRRDYSMGMAAWCSRERPPISRHRARCGRNGWKFDPAARRRRIGMALKESRGRELSESEGFYCEEWIGAQPAQR